MDTGRKDANIQIGKRLREARLNMNLEKSEIADVLDVTVDNNYLQIFPLYPPQAFDNVLL